MSTTAISYRRGTYSETSGWAGGAEAEITVDTTNQTLWVHDGNGTGTELARADLDNVSSTAITNNINPTILTTTYRLLTYDLNNFRGQDYSGSYVPLQDNNPILGAAVASYLDLPTNSVLSATYALTDLSNINPTVLTNTYQLLTYNLNNFRGQDWSSYYDSVTDTNTTLGTEVARYLGIPTSLSGYVTQTDLQNTLISYATISYVTSEISIVNANFANYQESSYKTTDITTYNDHAHYPSTQAVSDYVTTYVPTLMSGYEQTTNKVTSMSGSIDSTHYPSTQAVNDFVSNEIDNAIQGLDFVDTDLSNITDWSMAIEDAGTTTYSYDVNIDNPGSGYSVGDIITTTLTYIDPDTQTTKYFKIKVTEIDSSNGILDADIEPGIMNVSLGGQTYVDSGNGGEFSFVDNIYGIGGDLVDRSSNQNISGIKTFYQPVIIRHSGRDSENTSRSFFQAVNPEIDLTQPIATNTQNYTGLGCFDNNISEIAYCRGNSVRNSTDTANVNRLELYAADPDQTHTHQLGNRINTSIYLGTDGVNREATLNFTPATSSNSNQIATTKFVKDVLDLLFPAGTDYVIASQEASSSNLYTWYRKYKSGWVEQGGWISTSVGGTGGWTQVPLAINMQDTTSWRPIVSRVWDSATVVNVWADTPSSTSTFNVYTSNNTNVVWEVKGMAAIS